MSSKTCLCSLFLSFAALFCVEADAQLTLTSSRVDAKAETVNCTEFAIAEDGIPEGFTGIFAPPPLGAAGGGGAATLSTTINLNVADDGSSITAFGASTFDAQSTDFTCNGNPAPGSANAIAATDFQFVVSGAPVRFHYEGTVESAGTATSQAFQIIRITSIVDPLLSQRF